MNTSDLTTMLEPLASINSTLSSNEVQTSLRTSADIIISTTCLCIIMLFGLVGNASTIIVILLFRSMHKEHANMLIINLCVTDLSSTLLIMFSALISIADDKWPFGAIWCDCVCFINYCLIIVSMLTLCSISIDRYQAVINPLMYSAGISRKKILLVILYTWVQGIAFGLAPSVLGWVSYDYWEAICAIQWHMYKPSSLIYVIVAFIMCFFGPGVILAYCYSKILKEVKKQKNQVQATGFNMDKRTKHMNKKLSEKTRIVWSLLVVVFAYFVCMTPFSVTKLIKVSIDNSDQVVPGRVNSLASVLGYLASAINPLIYGIFRRDFRYAYKQLIFSLFSRKCKSHFNDSKLKLYQDTGVSLSNGDNVTVNKTLTNPQSQMIQRVSDCTVLEASGGTEESDLKSTTDDHKDSPISHHHIVIVKEKSENCFQNTADHH